MWMTTWLLLVGVAGCDDVVSGDSGPPLGFDPPQGPLAGAASRFDPDETGTFTGRVIWEGPVPEVPTYRAPVSPLSEQAGGSLRTWVNPNRPVIDPANRGVQNAVVFLRGVDPLRARPWDLPSVKVELRGHQVHVRQGEADRRVGVVRRGDPVLLSSGEPVFHTLQARGAAFFALTFPHPSEPCSRQLERNGVVELLSGAGYFWIRGYLFIDDHPYYSPTNPGGYFTLGGVPAGTYDLVCWLPNWNEAGRELDADTVQITRLMFRPALEVSRRVELAAGEVRVQDFRVRARQFSR
jgi:hypothetical protein